MNGRTDDRFVDEFENRLESIILLLFHPYRHEPAAPVCDLPRRQEVRPLVQLVAVPLETSAVVGNPRDSDGKEPFFLFDFVLTVQLSWQTPAEK